RINLDRYLCERGIKPDVGALGRKAGQLRNAIGAADGLDVLIKHLLRVAGRIGWKIARDRIRNRRSVLQREIWIAAGALRAVMAGEAGHSWFAVEVLLVD